MVRFSRAENKISICTCSLLFAGYSIPQVADRWLAGLELSVFQKVTQKVWFVVLVGLLLGLACGAVMARWPSLRGIAAGVAVVGVLLLGRVVGWLRQVVLGLATGLLAVATAPFARRFGVSELTWAIGLGFLVGVVWRIVGAMRRRGGSECGHACAVCALSSGDVKLSKQYPYRSPGVMCSDTGQPCTKGCDATAKPCDRNGSVHPNSAPPIDENAQIERLARLLHDAGRSAVEQGLTQNPGGAFVEWDDAPERTRAGRRSQAAYLLAAGVGLPTGERHEPPTELLRQLRNDVGEIRWLLSAKFQGPLPLPTDAAPSADAEQIKRDCAHAAEKLKSDPKLADNAKAHLDIAAKALADSLIRRETLRKSPFYVADDEREVTLIAQRPKFSKAYFLARIGADACYRLPDGKLDVKTANRALYDAFKPLVEGELLPPPPPAEHTDWAKPISVRLDDYCPPLRNERGEIVTKTPQPLQNFPTDEEIRAWRWWERVSASYPHAKLAELFFDAAGNLIDEQSAVKILRFSDGMESTQTRDGVTTTVLNDYRRDAWRKAPAPTVVPRDESPAPTTAAQPAQAEKGREAATK